MRMRILAAWRQSSPAWRAAWCLLLLVAGLMLVRVWQKHRHVSPESSVTLGNFRRLHLGMTEEQVEAILGEGKKAEDRMHRVMHYVGDECEVEILFDGNSALTGHCIIRRRCEGMTKEQVETILDEGKRAAGKSRWVWHSGPGGIAGKDSGVMFLAVRGDAVMGQLTKHGCWLREELRRKPPRWLSIIE